MMLRIYKAPNGACFQFEEGAAPDGYTLADEAHAPEKAAKAANKAKKPANKSRKAAAK